MKKSISLIVATCLLITATACKKNDTDSKNTHEEKTASVKDEKKHWSYDGETSPEHWAELENNECGGKFQSPVDIVNVQKDASLASLDIHYNEKTKIHDIVNNGHSIQFDFEPGDFITLEGKKYALKQFHFHASAEHTIDGVRYPLVIHLVHANEEGKLVVIAIMGKESPENAEPYKFLDKFLPVSQNETKPINESFDMTEVLPENQGYYTYEGSLTTPPCTEGIKWFILKEPIGVSIKLINDLKKLMPIDNYRGIQKLNGRQIKEKP